MIKLMRFPGRAVLAAGLRQPGFLTAGIVSHRRHFLSHHDTSPQDEGAIVVADSSA